MSSNNIYGSGMLFQAMNEELNASLATADELSREFSSLFQEVSSTTGSSTAQSTNSRPQNTISSKPSASSITSSISSGTKPSVSSGLEFSSSSTSRDGGGGGTFSKATMPTPQTSASSRYTEPSIRSADSYFLAKSITSSPNPQTQQYTSSQPRHVIPESAYSRGTLTPPNMSPLTQRKLLAPSNRSHVRSLSGSYNIAELTTNPKYDLRTSSSTLPLPGNSASPYESSTTGRRSPRVDRVPSPSPFSQPVSSTLPRNFMPFKSSDDTISRKRSPAKWNETDLDVSYERKTHHTYEKGEWMRQNVPNSNWRESNLDSATSPKKDTLPCHLPPIDGTLTRTTRISVPPDRSSPNPSLYNTPPIISRISIPPTTSGPRPHRPIPLSIIMRLQNPYYATATRHPHGLEGDMSLGMPLAQEFLYHFQPVAPEHRQTPAVSGSGPADVDAEVARLNTLNRPAVPSAEQNKQSKQEVPADDVETEAPPRPLSPSRLQPVVAPADDPLIPDLTEVLRIRAEFPRALKKRGSVDVSPSFKPPQYKQMIKKLFRMKGPQLRNEPENESGCSSDDESLSPATPTPPALTSINLTPQQRGLHSILRKPKGSGAKTQSGRARLSPLVLLLDGALVGELDTVQRAVQEMSDPSQPNDEGITALHNAICGGHYAVVEFLVCIGANVSAPDSHGWTPLHCAASCNDRALCEYLVRNGAAVMAVTESDEATAAQKCDPYAVGYEECESFLRGVEEAMGVENSGVLYALWTYPAQAPDELSFREGDMVTILQKPEGVNWWWASLCGREGFVPNNYFGLFPKVRPKSLC